LDGVSFAGCLLGKSAAPQRALFWHFPHYTNQGSCPSGAMREGRWMLVEYYENDKRELYDLATDLSEKQDVSSRHPDQVEKMHSALDAWRGDLQVQHNRPNPDFDPVKSRPLYIDVDASRFDPAKADKKQWQTMWSWREKMNAALREKTK
jgi:hypothetical protein